MAFILLFVIGVGCFCENIVFSSFQMSNADTVCYKAPVKNLLIGAEINQNPWSTGVILSIRLRHIDI